VKDHILEQFIQWQGGDLRKQTPETMLLSRRVLYETQNAFWKGQICEYQSLNIARVNVVSVLSSKEIVSKACAERTNSLQHFIF